ncbi:MAG: hypothetical protein M0Z59_09785 [Nitrospiraceae bacterium]|nr:hypothetical protein [Nitrospiraceae bacterium]
MKWNKKLWVPVVILVLLVPLGLWLPERFGAGGAWGEWAADGIKNIIGYVPRGLERTSGLWGNKTILPDYEVHGLGAYAGYLVSAAAGVAIVVAVSFLIGKALSFAGKGKKEKDRENGDK